MARISFKVFRGQVPRTSERLLAPNYAKRAVNCKITSGALDPLDGLQLTEDIDHSIVSMFRYRFFIGDVPVDNWLTFEDDTDVVLSPLSNDTAGRFYYTSAAHEPRISNHAMATITAPYPATFYSLGTPVPNVAASVVVTGGSGDMESRAYTYTFVTAFGEESGPAPASDVVNGYINGSWDLSAMLAVVPNPDSLTLHTSGMTKRIYRSAGTSGQFLFVAEIPLATTTYADTVPTTELGELIVTDATLPPPIDLTCLISLPNGCLAGISGNELCMSAPYRPYDWPIMNRYSFSGKGVALSNSGNSVFVLTDGYPILFAGSDPEAMAPSNIETIAPAVSKRGVVQIGGGCLYPSNDGLYILSSTGAVNVTKGLFRVDEWRAMNPSSFEAVYHDGQYMAVHDTPNGKRMLVIDIAEPDSTIQVIESATALTSNVYDGQLYLAKGGEVYRWDADPETSYVADWVSPDFQIGKPTNFSWAQVHADFDEIIPEDTTIAQANAALMALGPRAVSGHVLGNAFLQVPIAGSYLQRSPFVQKVVQFTLYSRGQAVFTKNVTSSKPFRLPAGFKSELVAVGISGSVRVHSTAIAESTAELEAAS
jgi:hypothetical protein